MAFQLPGWTTQKIWVTSAEMIELVIARSPFVIMGLLVFILFLICGHIAKKIIAKVGQKTKLDVNLAKILGSLASSLAVVLGLLVAAVVIFPGFSPGNLITGLGITSIAIGFAMKDILQNSFAGILILWRKPFLIGDEIRTKSFEGTVEDINIRSTYIQTYHGERVVIPNGEIYTNPVVVLTAYDKRRVRLNVEIAYLNDYEKAYTLIHQVLNRTEGVLQTPGPWVYVHEITPFSVAIDVYFWTRPLQQNVLKVTNQVLTQIMAELGDQGLEITYPHTVMLFPNGLDQANFKSSKEV